MQVISSLIYACLYHVQNTMRQHKLQWGKLFCILELVMDMNFLLVYNMILRLNIGNKSMYVYKHCPVENLLPLATAKLVSNVCFR